jgi:hypothetical protein
MLLLSGSDEAARVYKTFLAVVTPALMARYSRGGLGRFVVVATIVNIQFNSIQFSSVQFSSYLLLVLFVQMNW